MSNKDIQMDVPMEILSDYVLLEMILEVKRRVKNIYLKEYMSHIYIFCFCVIFHESIKGDMIGEKEYSPRLKKAVSRVRQRYLKTKPIKNSKTVNAVRNEMGLTFEYSVFDIQLLIDNKSDFSLKSINFALWDMDKYVSEEFEEFDALSIMPKRVIETFLRRLNIDEEITANSILKSLEDSFNLVAKELEEKTDFERTEYLSHDIFKSRDLNEEDKLLILNDYTLIQMMCDIDRYILKMQINFSPYFKTDPEKSVMKIKAVVIHSFFEHIKDLNTPLKNKIYKSVNENIKDKDFFILNRKLRNNIHYTKNSYLSKKELESIDINQKIYLNTIEDIFHDELTYDTGILFKICRGIARGIDKNYRAYKKSNR